MARLEYFTQNMSSTPPRSIVIQRDLNQATVRPAYGYSRVGHFVGEDAAERASALCRKFELAAAAQTDQQARAAAQQGAKVRLTAGVAR